MRVVSTLISHILSPGLPSSWWAKVAHLCDNLPVTDFESQAQSREVPIYEGSSSFIDQHMDTVPGFVRRIRDQLA
jgi:hypothetical protein